MLHALTVSASGICWLMPGQPSRARRLFRRSSALWLRHDVDARLLALLRSDRRRSVGQRVDTATGLRERDDLADGIRFGQQLDDPIPAERDPAVRRRTKGERVQQESELLLRLGGVDTHHREYAFLNVAAVDTN